VIVIDTTVWVDYFRGADEPHVAELIALIKQDAGVALTDVVMTEVLQGLRTDRQARRVEKRLKAFDVLRLQHLDDFTRAARLYRRARSKGYTVRKTIDCLIAAVCIRERVPLLHNDADFDRLAEVTPLLVHTPQTHAGS
jgi:predicted nucleic acid-binding protein